MHNHNQMDNNICYPSRFREIEENTRKTNLIELYKFNKNTPYSEIWI